MADQSPVLSREERRETIARTIYSVWPDSEFALVPSTTPWEAYRKEYVEVPWEEAYDRHADCLRCADKILDLLHRQDTTEGLREAIEVIRVGRDGRMHGLQTLFLIPGASSGEGTGAPAMDWRGAATEIHEQISKTGAAERSPHGRGLPHARFMAAALSAGEVDGKPFSHGKGNRWLGYLQGILVSLSVSSLKTEGERNKRHANPPPTDPKAESGEGAGELWFGDACEPDLASKIAAEVMSLKWTRSANEDEHCWRYGELQEVIEKALRTTPASTVPPSAVETARENGAKGLNSLREMIRERVEAETATVPPSAGDAGLADKFERLAERAFNYAKAEENAKDAWVFARMSARATAFREAARLARSSSTGVTQQTSPALWTPTGRYKMAACFSGGRIGQDQTEWFRSDTGVRAWHPSNFDPNQGVYICSVIRQEQGHEQ